jgi:putative ABC transport system substrate-binding protein
MMKRGAFLRTVSVGLIAAPRGAEAQQTGRVCRIGFLGNSTAALEANLVGPFREGLRELGYDEGRNVVIEYRWAEAKYERLPALIAELIALKVDVIVTAGTPAALAVKKATTSVPLVMVAVGDPVGTGVVASLARPGGNITGLTSIAVDLEGKRLELLREVIPKLSHVAMLWNPGSPFSVLSAKEVHAAAQVLRMKVLSLGVRTPEELQDAFATIVRERPGALLVAADRVFLHNRAHHKFHRPKPSSGGVCISGIGRGGRVAVLRAKLRGHAQAGRDVCGQDPQRREARGPSRRATHQV